MGRRAAKTGFNYCFHQSVPIIRLLHLRCIEKNRTSIGMGMFATAVLSAFPVHAAFVVSSSPTKNVSCSAGVCTPTAKNAVLNVNDLTTMLSGSNVTLTTGSGSLARKVKDIEISADFSWDSANSLTLDAYQSIFVNKAISVAAMGDVALQTNHDGTLAFGSKGSLTFARTTNSLRIDGTAYTLENSISALANAIAANPGGDYALANSYDASQDGTYSDSPIATTVTGTVEGLGNTISNLSIVNKEKIRHSIGLFTDIAASGAADSIRLTRFFVKVERGKNDVIGAAGLVGENQGLLFDDHVAGIVKTKWALAAGLAAFNLGGTIMASSAHVRIKSAAVAGGLVAATNESTIMLSSASGTIEGAQAVGGLVGANIGAITTSFASGTVKGADGSYAGGLVGVTEDSSADIKNTYATGAVAGGANSGVGGLIGSSENTTVETSYSTGAPTGGTGSYIGGFVGYWIESDFTDCYWDMDTSGTDQGTGGGNIDGITGLTTEQLQSGLPSGFDPSVWAENSNINSGFPYLIDNPPPNK